MQWLTAVFIVALLAATAVELWLSQRQMAEVERHRDPGATTLRRGDLRRRSTPRRPTTPSPKLRVGRLSTIMDTVLTLALTVGGGIAAIDAAVAPHQPRRSRGSGLLVIAQRVP